MRRRATSSLEETSLDEPLLNLTPLIDVVFVVLITFMLIAPILDVDSVDLATSIGEEKQEVATGSIAISVHADNSIWFRGKRVALKELETILIQEKKLHPKTAPQLMHDKQASFGTYQTLKNLLESIGFEQMDVILKPG